MKPSLENDLPGKALPVTVYTPEPALKSPRKLAAEMYADLLNSRGLAKQLAKRDLSAAYRQTYLGYVWAFLLPLVNTATWLFLNASGIVKLQDTGMPYAVYVLTGTFLWQIFTESLQSPLNEIAAAKPMIVKLNFPREALILSGIYKTLFNAFIKVAILIPAIMILGVYPDGHIVLFFLSLMSIILTGTAIGLLLSLVGLLYQDVGKAIPILTQFLMYITPVVFLMPAEGFSARIFTWNFMTPLILNGRNWLTGGEVQMLDYFIGVNIGAVILLLLSWMVYRITLPIITERMSA